MIKSQKMNEEINQFPITEHLDDICNKLKVSPSRFLVLTAQTAAGKSTILPLGLLQHFEGKILMTEPRRLAVLGVANRVAELRNENAGETVGYKIHLENKISSKTRLEVVTEAILVRQLQEDPALEDYQVVVLDEFHERSVNTDLALAFLKEAMQLRDDLFVIIMSATIDTEKLVNYLSNDFKDNSVVSNSTTNQNSIQKVPFLEIPGRQFPVEIIYDDKSTVEQAIIHELAEKSLLGDILAFLPGISDIRKTYDNLVEQQIDQKADIFILHSSISLEEQKKIIKEKRENTEKRRIILSSAIAETSLTVPGITCVIDSGLSRINRMNVSTGMENLSTETESDFSAEQRAGRAGRLAPGKCIRLWSKANARIKELPPEILRTDITQLILECSERGIFTFDGIDWLDKPSESAWKEGVKLLINLGFIKNDGRITPEGKIALGLGVSPRLAGICIHGYKDGKLDEKAREYLIKYGSYSKSSKDVQSRFINDIEKRIIRLIKNISVEKINKNEKIPLVLYGFPDRLAKRIESSKENEKYFDKDKIEFQFYTGRKAFISTQNSQSSSKNHVTSDLQWIVVPELLAGDREGVIFEYEALDFVAAEAFLEDKTELKVICSFENGKIQKNEQKKWGQIVLQSKKMVPSAKDYSLAWENEVLSKGFNVLPVDSRLDKFLWRAEFYFQQNQKKLNDKNIREYLAEKVHEWLSPFLNSQTNINSETVYNAVYWFLDGSKIDKEVPELLILENGRKCKVNYEKQSSPDDKNVLVIRPVIEIIIQRIFGVFSTPKICGMKVLLRLLSPASRPLQVTDDLEGFWNGAWPEICKEMKGRYPKHNWNYKICEEKDV